MIHHSHTSTPIIHRIYKDEICVVILIYIHSESFRPVLQPHEISSKVVFRPLSMDERPTVVLGLLALWTGPENFDSRCQQPGELQTLSHTEAATHLRFCCPFRVQQGLPTDGTAHGPSPKFPNFGSSGRKWQKLLKLCECAL